MQKYQSLTGSHGPMSSQLGGNSQKHGDVVINERNENVDVNNVVSQLMTRKSCPVAKSSVLSGNCMGSKLSSNSRDSCCGE